MNVLVKAQRAQQLYLPNNPVYQKTMESLQGAFRHVWESTDDLVLEVGEHDLRWEGHSVYVQPSRNESISWVFYKDGVRQITFQRGVEEREIFGVLDVVQ